MDLLNILRADVVEGAKALLGSTLVRGELRAQIVEVEAYRASDDPASHAFRGLTPRNQVMFGEPGLAYVYFSYGVHWMLNVTAHTEGDAAAVLVRAAKPLAGIEIMRERRGVARDHDLLSGPGKLTQAFAITGKDNGLNLLDPSASLYLIPPTAAVSVLCGPRIGIAEGKGHETLWRFVDADLVAWASRPRKLFHCGASKQLTIA